MEILPLTPDMADSYFALFDHAFVDNPHWAGCYCAFYDVDIPSDQWDPSDEGFASRNRESRKATIVAGEANGLLAFEEESPIGWVNAGPRDSYRNLRHFAEAIEDDDPPTGAIMCFVIHPAHRQRGVASALLGELDEYFRSLNLAQAEAYPRKAPPDSPDFPWTAAYYKGSPSMYESAGYVPHREFEHFVAMRKKL